jgi:CheY-like chemotaxis protein
MTGLELYRHLTSAGYAIPTVLVTAYPDEGVRAQALTDGVLCYLRKPVDEKELVRCLQTAVRLGQVPSRRWLELGWRSLRVA